MGSIPSARPARRWSRSCPAQARLATPPPRRTASPRPSPPAAPGRARPPAPPGARSSRSRAAPGPSPPRGAPRRAAPRRVAEQLVGEVDRLHALLVGCLAGLEVALDQQVAQCPEIPLYTG